MSANQLLFSTRIVSVDSYMCDPVPGLDISRSEFRKSDVKSVPVVRVFGSTPSGQTTCLHIHGVFPYLMVPYCGPDVMESHWSEVEQYMQQMAAALDNALNSASGKSNYNRQHVFKIVMLRGIPLYGYHEEEELFLKIYVYLPGDIKRSAELLQSGMVLDRQFQPHEAHIPYILQLFLDYNLYGMNLLHAKNCWFRLPIGKPDPVTELPTIKRPDDIPLQEVRGQRNEAKLENSDVKVGKRGEKIPTPTMSQLRNFNWNLLREKSQRTYSQKHQQGHQEEDLGDSDLPHVSSNSLRRTSKDDNSQASITQTSSCSDLCKSLLSKTFSNTDSEDITMQPSICPLHTHWYGHNVPPASKLLTDVERHSTCDLEVDVIAADISNRDELAGSSTSNPGIAAIWEDERARRVERDKDSQIPVDQSQPRVLGSNLSQREAHYVQMLYDALDRFKEENSLSSSYDDSLSVPASLTTRRPSSDAGPQRRESKDMFASSGESATKSSKQDAEMLSTDSTTPRGSQDLTLTQGISQGGCSLEEDVSTLELMKKLEEEEQTDIFGTPRGNGPLDVDNEQLTPEDFARLQNMLKKQLSFSLSNSQHITTPDSPLGDTQLLVPPSDDDDDAIEEFEMSQRWDSAIQDLLRDLSVTEIPEDDGDDIIPQLDGASDGSFQATNKCLGSTKRSCSLSSKSKSPNCSKTKSIKELKIGVNTTNTEEKSFRIVNINASKASDGKTMAINEERASVARSDATISSDTMENCTDVTANDADNLANPSDILLNILMKSNTNVPESSTLDEDPKISCKNADRSFNTGSDSFTNTNTGGIEAGDEAVTSYTTVEPAILCNTKKSVGSRTSRSSEIKDRVVSEKLRNLDEMVENFVLVETGNPGETGGTETEAVKKTKITDNGKTSGIPDEQNGLHDSNVSTSRKKALKDTVLKRVEARTNVFTTILNENPGVTLYDETVSKTQYYRHSAVIDLDSLPADNSGALTNFNNALIKITSTPVLDDEPDSEIMCTRRLRQSKKCKEKAEKTTRTRRPRVASKNSYVENPNYETVFDSDCDSDESTNFEMRKPKINKTKRTSNDYKRKRKSKLRVITKWVIVNRFKGMSNMKIGLWKIPTTKRVRLTPDLIRLYELYSPTKCNIISPPVKPLSIPTTARSRPMGKRSKHMLAILCPFGPNLDAEKSVATISTLQAVIQQNEPKELSKKLVSKSTFSRNENEKPYKLTSPASSKSSQEINTLEKHESLASSHFTTTEKFPQKSSSTTKLLFVDANAREFSSSARSQTEIPKLHPSDSLTTKDARDVAKESSANNAVTPVLEKIALDARYDARIIEEDTMQGQMTQDEAVKLPHPALEKILDLDMKINSDSTRKFNKRTVFSSKDAKNNAQNNPERSTSKRKTTHVCLKMLVTQNIVEKLATQNGVEKLASQNIAEKLTSQNIVEKLATQNVVEKLATQNVVEKLASQNVVEKLASQNVEKLATQSVVEKLATQNIVEKLATQNVAKKVPDKTAEIEICDSETSNATVYSKGAEDIMKTHPILSSIFLKTKQLVKKSERKKEKNVKSKKETRKKKSTTKLERNSSSPHDSDKDRKVLPRSIVPVSSRTVEPLCNRVSPEHGVEALMMKESKPVENISRLPNPDSHAATPKTSSSPQKSKSRRSVNPSMPAVMPCLEKVSTGMTDSQTPTTSPVKKTSVILLPSTKKVYSPSRKVTRNSVAVKLNAICAPDCMFGPFSDDSADTWPPLNVLAAISFPSPSIEPKIVLAQLPRPWSPKLTHAPAPVPHEEEADEILEDFAESFGADATKMLGIGDDPMFKNMDCIDQLIDDNQSTGHQKETVDKTDSFSNIKDDSEKMLKHFDKIFENVSSNAGATSKGSQSQVDKPSPVHLDEFEEETLMEYIDEMTSPTQPTDSDPSQSHSSSYPLIQTTPQSMRHDSNGITTPRMVSPTVRDLDVANVPVLPVLPAPSQPQKETPQNPLHSLRSAFPQQTRQNLSYKNDFIQPFGSRQPTQGPADQHLVSEPRPQSCRPVQGMSGPIHMQRPASALDHRTNRVVQSQPCLYSENHMKEIKKNVSFPNIFTNHGQSCNFLHVPEKSDCSYYASQNIQSQPLGRQVPPPYSQMPGQYTDPGQVPRPANVMDQPLQVFHTHVHHHHHVHSMDNQPSGSTCQYELGTPQPQQRQAQPLATNIKSEAPSENVKMDNASNTPWPNSSMAAPERSRLVKPMEKPKTSKTQFYVPNSPFPYPKQPAPPIQLGPRSLVQTLTYVETSASQTFASGKSDFYAFAGVRPAPQPQHSFSPSIGNKNAYSEIISVLLKGSCQLEHNIRKEISRNAVSGLMVGPKNSSRERGSKTKLTWNPLPTSPTFGKQQTPVAKTPYGLMKQNSLNAAKKIVKPSKVVERKRKTISDFRAPPGTPTISLTGGTSAGDSATRSDDFESSSQDMFEKSPHSSSGQIEVKDQKKTFSTYNFAFISDEAKKKAEKDRGKNLKLTINKTCLMKSLSKNAKQRWKRSRKRPESRVDSSSRPVPRKGEELVLDPVTGNWEVALIESFQKDVPVVFAPEEQLLSKFKPSDLGCEVQRIHSGEPFTSTNYFCDDLPPISRYQSISLKDDPEDFAVAKKKKKLPKFPVEVKRASSTPEYIVSSVDFQSNSPRLKLTLKKTPPCRGKPHLSTLVTAIHKHCGSERAPNSDPVIINLADSSDDSDFNPSKKLKKHLQKNIDSDSDSDFRIEDASNSSTDDAPEAAEVWSPGEIEPRSLDFQSHLDAVKNMYTLIQRPPSKSVLVDLNKTYIRTAVVPALDTKVRNFVKLKNSTTLKKTIGPVGRSKSGRFVSLAKMRELEGENEASSVARKVADVRISTDAPPPVKMMKIVPNVDSSPHSTETPTISTVAGKVEEGVRPNPMQKPASCEEDDQTAIKSLLFECCTIITARLEQITVTAQSEPAAPSFSSLKTDSMAIHTAVNDAVSCPGQGSDRNNTRSATEADTLCSVKAIPPNQASGGAKHSSDNDPNGTRGPPSPGDGEGPPRKQSLFLIGDSNFVYRTVLKPPSKNEVICDIKTMKIETASTSNAPFYGNESDTQMTSHRLSNLPPYIKRPKARKSLRDLPKYQSNLPLEGGLHHWAVLTVASQNRTEIENAILCRKASVILPPNVHVWDHIDAITKLSQYPVLAKIFLNSGKGRKEITLRPAVLPPSRKEVEKWLQDKRSEKAEKKQRPKKNEIFSQKTDDAGLIKEGISTRRRESPAFTPSSHRGGLRRSLSLTPSHSVPKSSRPRRVSFDLSNITQADETISPMSQKERKGRKRSGDLKQGSSKISKLESIKGSPIKPGVYLRTELKTTETQISKPLPFADLMSPPGVQSSNWDGTMSFTVSPPTLPSIQSAVTPEGSSRAIQILVGSSDTDKTSPLTFLISGSFTPPPCSTRDLKSEAEDDGMMSSLKKHPQSTPNTTGGRQKKHALRKLAFTPIEITPEGANSPSSTLCPNFPSQQTPTSKNVSLRKSVLAKKLRPSDASEALYPTTSNMPVTKESPVSSPVVLTTPQMGQKKEGSQINGPTLDNTYGFKAAQQHLGEAKSLHVVQHITTVGIELHVKTRIDLRPDPDMDEIRCLFYCLNNDAWTGTEQHMRTGVIIVDPDSISKRFQTAAIGDQPSTSKAETSGGARSACGELLKNSGITCLDAIYVKTEMELFLIFAQMMHEWDPDILVGYEVQMLSWGFLLQRASHLRCDLCRALSRIPTDEQRNRYQAEKDSYGADNASELHVVGRIVLNLWRLMRTELALYDYSFESVAYHLLHERYPKYSHHTLTNWFDPPSRSGQTSHVHRHRVIDYYVVRVRGNMKLLQQQDLVDRTSELARLFGIQFYEVLTRGSQFRVESMLLRTARAHNFVAVTPNVLQRAQMRAPEVIALVMEPESKFYHVPVLVLDFQSLYPSIVIAYNICYSTCLGRVELLGSDANFMFGCTSLRVPAKTLKKLLRKNLITINPSGVAFVKSSVRRGVMPQMLDDILTTRIMVKNSMKKLGPDQSATRRMLDHRQLGLKLIANVTYGYTAANFSGRMPCVEVGDSIVHKARETLERAVRLVTRYSERWENARVVYGDTDSMFIALEGTNNSGCSKQRAFEIGKEIAAEVTADNPTPVKLKFEKVYLPCVLQTKKRYVGYAYETEDQKEPIFDAKGIETVRRDGTPATAKILEKMLKILFETRDVSKVKEYVLMQCSKILNGRTTLKDCIIAKEYRGKQYYKPGAVVPALNIAKKLLAMDKRAEPRVGERVPYVVVYGAPGTPLYQLVRSPLEVLKDPSLQLNGAYYVTKQVLPALDRVLSLLGVDVFLWHRHLPRTIHVSHNMMMENSQNITAKKETISHFFKSKHCLMCKQLSIRTICDECLSTVNNRRQITGVSLAIEARSLERRKHAIEQICMQCTGASCPSEVRCESLDCPILYKLHRAADEFSKTKTIRKALSNEEML